MNNFGEQIRKRRMNLGMTQKDCAYAFGAGESYWRAIEAGRAAVGSMRKREIEKILNMSEGWLK